MTKVRELHARWMKSPAYAKEYAALEDEYRLASEIIAARTRAKMTQAELATKMQTNQSTIARLESGAVMPSTRTLARIAAATGMTMQVRFVPRTPAKKKAARPQSGKR